MLIGGKHQVTWSAWSAWSTRPSGKLLVLEASCGKDAYRTAHDALGHPQLIIYGIAYFYCYSSSRCRQGL